MVDQHPGEFEATQKSYFYQHAQFQNIELARRIIRRERFHPATRTLWFYMEPVNCPSQWFNQWNSGALNHIVSLLQRNLSVQ